jgi:Fur family ferric uptake transcriptional regulator
MREHGLPATAQRLAIAGLVLESDHHLSADDIARELAAKGTNASVATVYRTLELLLESGLVVERDLGEGFRRFEAAREPAQHEQLLCTTCGRVEEFIAEELERLTAVAAASHGFVRERHRLVIYGLCRDCAAAARAPA